MLGILGKSLLRLTKCSRVSLQATTGAILWPGTSPYLVAASMMLAAFLTPPAC
jgi:hypothetical protein